MRKFVTLLILGALSGCATPATLPSRAGDPNIAPTGVLPVTAVTLFSGGTAYIEHRGSVRDNATVELRFKPGQVASVLRSLTVDAGEDARPTISVQSPDSASTTQPSDVSPRVDLASNPPLADMLQRLRGSRVRVPGNGQMVEGAILSLEKKESDKKGSESWLLHLYTDGGIRTVSLDSLSRIELTDPRANREIKAAVEALWQTEVEERRTIIVQLPGKGERPVKLAYTVDAQAWKQTYRLTLGDAKPMLQAWASIVNDTDVDWKNVQLTLVASQPIVLSGSNSVDTSSVSRAAKAAGIPAGEPIRKPKPVPSRQALDDPEKTAVAVRATPSAPVLDARQVLRQTVENVSIARKGTLILPVFSENVEAERVAVFNEGLLKRNALQGARLRNTGKHYLLQGAVSVVDSGEFAGDCTIENLAPGRTTQLAWGLDLTLLVDASDDNPVATVSGGKIEKGVLQLDRRHLYTRNYVIENESSKDHSLVIEHPIRRGWTLLDTPEPAEASETMYRFVAAVPSGKRVTFSVKEQIKDVEPVELLTAEFDTVQQMAQDAALPREIRSALAKVVDFKSRGDRFEREIRQKLVEMDKLIVQHQTARDGLKALAEDSPNKPTMQEKFDQLDKQLSDLRQTIDKSQKSADQVRQELETYLNQLTIAGA